MIEPLKITSEDIIQSDRIILKDKNYGNIIIEVLENMICITYKDMTWYAAGDSKLEFEQIIKPSSNIKKYIKRHIHYFLTSLAKLFDYKNCIWANIQAI